MGWLIWFIAALVLLGAEIFVPGFYIASFGLAAAAAAAASALGASLTWQLWAFVGTAAFVFTVARPVVMAYLQRPDRRELTGTAALIGREGEVVETIRPGPAGGRVKVGGDEWRARTVGPAAIPDGTIVTILRVEGATLEVRAVPDPTLHAS